MMGQEQLSPVLQWLLGAGCIGVVFNAGAVYTNFKYIKQSMVTKKDLAIAMLKETQRCDDKYATRVELHNATRGKTHAAKAGGQGA